MIKNNHRVYKFQLNFKIKITLLKYANIAVIKLSVFTYTSIYVNNERVA